MFSLGPGHSKTELWLTLTISIIIKFVSFNIKWPRLAAIFLLGIYHLKTEHNGSNTDFENVL